jgi:cytochrome b561
MHGRTVRIALLSRRAPAALRTDVPVLVALLACWMTVSVPWAHLACGLGFVGLLGMHLRTRWRRVRALVRPVARPRGPRARRAVHVALVLVALAAALTGVLRWGGFARIRCGTAAPAISCSASR